MIILHTKEPEPIKIKYVHAYYFEDLVYHRADVERTPLCVVGLVITPNGVVYRLSQFVSGVGESYTEHYETELEAWVEVPKEDDLEL